MKRPCKKSAAALLALALCLSMGGCRSAANSLKSTVSDTLDGLPDALSDTVDSLQTAISEGLENIDLPNRLTDLDRQGYSLQSTIDTFCQAADSQDAEAIKALFSANVRAEVGDDSIDAAIEQLFDFYPGPTEECAVTRTPGGSGHYGFMENSFTTSAWIPVVSQRVNYYCYISLTTEDQADRNNLGIQRLLFVSEKARCSTDIEFPTGKGMFVIVDAPGDYQTCRIGDEPHIYTPVDRVITQEGIGAFLEENNNWDAFTAQFGEPNAAEVIGDFYRQYFYELPDVDGEKRYAEISLSSDGSIYGAYLYDGKHYSAIGTIWRAEKEDAS